MSKNIKEWLETIEDSEIKEKALKNFSKQGIFNSVQSSLVHAIESAFVWSETPEGSKYWISISQDFRLNNVN